MAAENWMWLAAGLGYGAVNSGDLLEAFPGGAEEIAANLGSGKMDELLTQKQAGRLAGTRPQDFALRINHYATQGVFALGYDDPEYPETLRRITNPPPVLFVKGDTALLNGQLSIGMVGARRPSAYGVECAKALGRGIALGGAIIVSGLAAGLDSEAHKAALAVGGPTVACIAFGHDQCYPAANRKLMEVIENNGAVVSEYPLGTTPEKPYFLHRNRLIAGLSHGLVVVEARRYSGTMSTVNFAVDYGRDVFAVPGSVFSELSGGTNAMIREGAYLAATAADVLTIYGADLPGEDPVTTLGRKSFEGKPEPAAPLPQWQQNLARFSDRMNAEQSAAVRREELPGQQSLADVPAGRVGSAGPGGLSTPQAIEAFRLLQQEMPAADDSALDARNRALDDMVSAVSDRVQLSSSTGEPPATAAKAAPKAKKDATIKPFQWDKLERLDKRDVQDLSPAKTPPEAKAPGKKPSVASRLFGSKEKQPPQAAASARLWPVPTVGYSPDPVGRVSAVEPVDALEPASGARPVAAVTPAALRPLEAARSEPEKPATKTQPETKAPAAKAAAPRPSPRQSASLAGHLSTLQKPQESAASARPPGFAGARAAPAAVPTGGDMVLKPQKNDPFELLSDEAKRAYAQLGPRPVPLAVICEKSGLSSAEAMAALTELELAGLSRQLAGRQFVIMQ